MDYNINECMNYDIVYVDGEIVIRGKDGIDRTTLSEYENSMYEQRDVIAEHLFSREIAKKD